jgi:cytoskeleton protein RodZ
MNDPAPLAEPTAEAAPDSAPAPAVGNFGAALRAGREAAGISVSTLAGRLRLHVKQIEALERSDLAALPTLIYVRGFVRSCARELKIDGGPLLEDLDRRAGVVPGTPQTPAGGSFQLARLGDGSRSIVVIALALLVLAGVIGTLWPRRASVPPKAAVVEPPPPSAAVPAPATPPDRTSTESAAPSVATVPPSAAPGPATRPATALVAASHQPLSKAAPARPTDASATAAAAAVPVVPASGAAPPPPVPADIENTLVLHVHASSWVEVVQANGTSVFSQICPAGSVQTVHGTPPLRIVVGNAAAVEAQFRGAAVDLNRYANANGVARFTLQ